MPSSGHHVESRVGERSGEAGPEFAELGVVLTGKHQHRRRDPPEPTPERLLGSGSGRPQTRGEPDSRVAQSVCAQGGLRAESGEQGVGQPLVDEGLDADPFDAFREPLVGRSPCSPLRVVVDAGRRADQDQCAHVVGVSERGVQHDPASHRVADIGRATAEADEMIGARPEVGIARCGGVTVAREIDRDGVDVGEAIGQQGLEVCPRPCGLGEPVGEDESFGQDGSPFTCIAILYSTLANVSGSCAPGMAHFPSIT